MNDEVKILQTLKYRKNSLRNVLCNKNEIFVLKWT